MFYTSMYGCIVSVTVTVCICSEHTVYFLQSYLFTSDNLTHICTHVSVYVCAVIHSMCDRDGWIDTHEASKKSDFNPTHTLYHWRTDEKLLMKTALDKVFASMSRFKSRRHEECEKGFSLVEFVAMSETERARFTRLAAVLGRIDHALMNLDDTLMLFTCL